MIDKSEAMSRITNVFNEHIANLSNKNVLFNIVYKPILSRSVDKLTSKLDKVLSFVADEKGMVDVEGILNDMFNNMLVSNQQGDGFSIENGNLTVDVPGISELIITKEDMQNIINQIIKK